MCGICGIVDFGSAPIDEEVLWSMTRTLRHRGPDDEGVELLGPAGLGQTRLSIIDLSSAGHQPMQSQDGRVTLVYNGEIYNFPRLREQLETEGVAFRGRSDTEVVLKAYVRWGTDAFSMFEGMFALAIWDAASQQLHLARDRFGIKPLYHYSLSSGLVFGSEIKALLASRRLRRRLNWHALHEYLYYGNALGPNTLFGGVVRLLPGHYLTLDRDGSVTSAYWSVEAVEPVTDDLEQATAVVRQRLETAVKEHLISDVPVGVFLSGGIDSSAVTAFASRHYTGRLKTYSVGFDFDKGVNELPKARKVAERLETEHTELHLAGGDMADVIQQLIRCHDEPFGDAANIPLYLLCRELKGSVKVVLQGDGGDEIFAGYRRYNVLCYERFWRWIAQISVALPTFRTGGLPYDRAMRFFQAMGHPDPAMRLALLMTEEPCNKPPTRVFSDEARRMLQNHDPFGRYRGMHKRLSQFDAVQRSLYTDTQVLLPDTFLEKVDKPTMAHSIEVRVPMLDANLTSYVMGLPSNLKVRSGQKKWILRRALRGIVPDAILDGPKTGFGVPYGYWLRKPLADYTREVLLDPAADRWDLFDRGALALCLEEHTSGRKNNGFLLYKLLNLAIWHHAYLNGPSSG